MPRFFARHTATLFFPMALILYDFAAYLSTDLIQPGIINVVRDFNADVSLAPAAVSLYLAGGMALQWLLGPLSDRIGRRPVLITGALIFTLACAATMFTTSMTQFLIARAIQGTSICFIATVGYVTVQEAADRCNVSYTGLEQHLIFYHKELVENRIKIREQATKQQRKGKITGRGTLHVPPPETIEKYAEALHLYRTTPMSARKIAKRTGVSIRGFYDYLQTWHKDLVCERKGIPYEEGKPVDWSSVRKYNPDTAAKYADAIARLKEGGLTMAKVAAEFGLHPECFRQYLKEHEPELHACLGMKKTEKGKMVSPKSMEKYKEAIHLYETTSESLKSIARRFGLNDCSLGQFIKRHFSELIERRKQQEQVNQSSIIN